MTNQEVHSKIVASFKFIRKTVLQIIRRRGAKRLDPDEAVQEVNLRLLQRAEALSSEGVPWELAIVTIAEQAVGNLLRDDRAEKRGGQQVLSLNVTVETNDEVCVELGDTIGQRERDARLGLRTRSDQEAVDLATDLASMLAKTSAVVQETAELVKTKLPSEIEAETGIPASTVYDRMRRLRTPFEEEGLREYF
jgi:DNA-directed RNA polymerase specialized sigma24 family protein